ncbi:MAG: FhaA domain-containing protein [Actinomycetota bacterium]
MGLQRFERRLERLVEGTFSRASRSGLQPVEIGRRLAREMDVGRTLGIRGTVAPNDFTIELSDEDAERFAGFAEALARELADAARDHARDQGYLLEGPVAVTLVTATRARRGSLTIRAAIVAGPTGGDAWLTLTDGRQVALGPEPVIIGRLTECAVTVSDPRASRHHAEVAWTGTGFRVADLESTNGTLVNGVAIREQVLADGDVITIGGTEIRFEST